MIYQNEFESKFLPSLSTESVKNLLKFINELIFLVNMLMNWKKNNSIIVYLHYE